MTEAKRPELRAFPRLACAHPAELEIGGAVEPCQVLDVSYGGCKVMPLDLGHVVTLDLRPQTPLTVAVDDLRIPARLAWATPNSSALGCSFDKELTEAELRVVIRSPG
jgi:hypothetical protein